jgi:HSP20 family protein
MASVVRWNPVREMMTLRNAMDRLFDESFDVPVNRWADTAEWSLALDVVEDQEGFLVRASLPGINPEDIDVTVNDNVLFIKAELHREELVENARYHLSERRFGTFSRAVTLPLKVDQDAIEATYEHGILTLHIPKAEELKPRRIAIKTSGPKVLEEANE